MAHAFRIWLTAAVLAVGFPAAGFPLSILLPTDRSVPPLTLVRHEQKVVINDQVARTTLHQVFHNPTGRQLEAVYLFPLPKGAQVTDFSMIINGQKVHGEVLERDKARGIYEDIVRRLRDPGLIEYMDDNLLRVRVFPIPASGDQAIDLELSQVLPREGDLVRYEFPFGVDPGRSGLPADLAGASLSLEIHAKHPLSAIYSPTHTIDTKKSNGDRDASIVVDPKDLAKGRDFALYFATSEQQVGVSMVPYRPDSSEPGYFMLLVNPRHAEDVKEVVPKDVTFVLDTSGSMAHDAKLDQAKDALIQCIGALREGDRFNLVRFSTDVESLSDSFLPATAESRKRAEEYVRKLVPRGGTNIEGALTRALQPVEDKSRLHVVVFMTDGQPTVGQTVPQAMLRDVEQRNTAGLRIFTFGLGYDVNTRFLDDIAATTRATADYIKPGENVEQRVTGFFDKVSVPALTNCELTLTGGDTFDLYPQQIPDLFQGQQLVVFGRYRASAASAIVLKGKVGDKPAAYEFKADFPKEEKQNEFVEALWGTRKIGFLLDQIRRNGESAEVRDEVVRLAKKYNVVTPYTSFLVTEDLPQPVPVAGGVPRPSAAPPVYLNRPERMQGRSAQEMSLGQPMQAATGAVAVDQSLALRDLKEKETLGYKGASFRQITIKEVDGRTMLLRDGVWSDNKTLEPSTLPTLKVQFGSAAYFEILTLRKDLKPVLQLGERVIVRLDKVTLEIGPEGVEQLTDTDRALLK